MVVYNVFVVDISSAEQSISAMLKDEQDGNTIYVVDHVYPKDTPDVEIDAAIRAKIDSFVLPQRIDERDSLVQELLG